MFELRKLLFLSLSTEIKVSLPAGREPEQWQEERRTEGGTSRKGETETFSLNFVQKAGDMMARPCSVVVV